MSCQHGPPEIMTALSCFVKLMRAADSVGSAAHAHLAAYRLSISQFGVLEALYHLGPMCQRQIAAKILKSSGNLTLVIDNLEKAGLVVRVSSEQDRRRFSIELTPAGRELIARIFPGHAQGIAQALSGLDEAEQRELARLCRKLKPPCPAATKSTSSETDKQPQTTPLKQGGSV